MFHQQRQHGRGQKSARRNSATSGAKSGVNDTNSNTNSDSNNDDDHDQGTPSPLSPSALRAGLGSLGIPLGDDDFVTLIATTDPDRRGEVSYSKFCEALNLHRLRSSDVFDDRRYVSRRRSGVKGGGAGSPPERSSSAPPRPRSSQITRQGVAVGGGGRGCDSEMGGEGGGYARRRAMKLTPPADARTDLEGGIFHLNPATHGCANPNFTTTMIPVWNGRGGGTAQQQQQQQQSAEGAYRSKRRQSPAGVNTRAKKQTIYVVGGGTPFKETGAEAEKLFRQGFGMKMRYGATQFS